MARYVFLLVTILLFPLRTLPWPHLEMLPAVILRLDIISNVQFVYHHSHLYYFCICYHCDYQVTLRLVLLLTHNLPNTQYLELILFYLILCTTHSHTHIYMKEIFTKYIVNPYVASLFVAASSSCKNIVKIHIFRFEIPK